MILSSWLTSHMVVSTWNIKSQLFTHPILNWKLKAIQRDCVLFYFLMKRMGKENWKSLMSSFKSCFLTMQSWSMASIGVDFHLYTNKGRHGAVVQGKNSQNCFTIDIQCSVIRMKDTHMPTPCMARWWPQCVNLPNGLWCLSQLIVFSKWISNEWIVGASTAQTMNSKWKYETNGSLGFWEKNDGLP